MTEYERILEEFENNEEDSWESVSEPTINFWNPKETPEIIGVYTDTYTYADQPTRPVLETKHGRFVLPSHTVLLNKFKNISFGELVKVDYLDQVKNYFNYEIYRYAGSGEKNKV